MCHPLRMLCGPRRRRRLPRTCWSCPAPCRPCPAPPRATCRPGAGWASRAPRPPRPPPTPSTTTPPSSTSQPRQVSSWLRPLHMIHVKRDLLTMTLVRPDPPGGLPCASDSPDLWPWWCDSLRSVLLSPASHHQPPNTRVSRATADLPLQRHSKYHQQQQQQQQWGR